MNLIADITDQLQKEPSGRYVRWGKVWHGRDSIGNHRTYCGLIIPSLRAKYQREQPAKVEACGRCFDV